jgi:hypothetical protein
MTRVLFVAALPSLAKSPTFGDIAFQVEGQSAILGKVSLCDKVVVLVDIAFLGEVPAVIITSILLVSMPATLVLLPLSLRVTTSIVLASLTSLQGAITFVAMALPTL